MTKHHQRKLGLSGASMTSRRVPNTVHEAASRARDAIESLMTDSGYLDDAPFEWVTISLRFGLKNEDEPHYESINSKYGDLPLAIELKTDDLFDGDADEVQKAIEIASLKALIHAGSRYGLPTSSMSDMLSDRVS